MVSPRILLTIPKRGMSKTIEINPKYELYKLDAGPRSPAELSADDALSMFKKMTFLRRMENKAAELYRQKLINGFCHLYSGQEAVAVGIESVMQEHDTVITAYRCHGFSALFGATARQVFAELMGRATGVSKGKGGSMHMYGPRFYGGDGIVGGQVPVGAGIAFAHKYNGNGAVSFALYGDGAASQGQIAEAWNMSKLWSLPAVFICENNRFGMGTATHRHSANNKFYTRGDLIPGVQIDGMKVEEVREGTRFAREHAVHKGPIILEMVTYRYFGHSMSDPGTAYRTRDEVKSVQAEQDPIKHFTELCVNNNLIEADKLEEIKKGIWKEVDEQVGVAKNDAWPELSAIGEDLYVNKLEKIRGMVPWQLH